MPTRRDALGLLMLPLACRTPPARPVPKGDVARDEDARLGHRFCGVMEQVIKNGLPG